MRIDGYGQKEVITVKILRGISIVLLVLMVPLVAFGALMIQNMDPNIWHIYVAIVIFGLALSLGVLARIVLSEIQHRELIDILHK